MTAFVNEQWFRDMVRRFEKVVGRLRYVSKGDYVLHQDIDDPVEACKVFSDIVQELARLGYIDPKYAQEMDECIKRLRYVKAGDIIQPEDHNAIVDCLKKVRFILEVIETRVYQEGYEAGYQEGYNAGILYCLQNLVPLKHEVLIGADIEAYVDLSEAWFPALIFEGDIVIRQDPALDIGHTVYIGAEVELSEDPSTGLNSEVSIERQS